MKSFSLATRLCFGADALSALKALKAKKTLLVTDAFFTRSGKAQEILALCGEGEIFDAVRPDPDVSTVAQGVKRLRALKPDLLLALGGGSVIDCAKGMLSLERSGCRLAVIPTTSGSGSEVTSFAILTHNGVKHPLIDEALRPELAILEPGVLTKMPKSLIAETGMDVLSHCLEAAASKNASAFTDAMAAGALRICLRELARSFEGDLSAREAVHEAASMAGIAFDQAGLGVCHALSHALGGVFHLSHGKLNAILLPHVLEFNLPFAADAYRKLSFACGLGSPRALSFALCRLRKRLSLPESLTQAGMERSAVLERLDELCRAASFDACLKTNPRSVSAKELAELLRRAI